MLSVSSQHIPPANNLLFVYGTLKRGGYYHRLLQQHDAQWVGTALLVERYPLVVSDYPCLIDQPRHGHRVRGEVFRIVTAEGWRTVDQLEDHPNEYERREEEAELSTGEVIVAWVYFYRQTDRLPPQLPLIDDFPV